MTRTGIGRRRRGAVLIYATIGLTALVGVCSLAVDWGRVQLVKTELSAAADSSARAGAGALLEGPANAVSRARWAAAQNKADGYQVDVLTSDVQLGVWDTQTKAFVQMFGNDQYRANAVRVTATRHNTRNNAVPMSFASLFGKKTQNVTVEATAMFVPPIDVNHKALATANPFLAGMPAGSRASVVNPHNSPDVAGTINDPKQSPMPVNLRLTEGQKLTFDSIDGTARHDPNLAFFNPDGELTDIGHNNLTRSDSNSYGMAWSNENGIADMRGPINALVGVFLTDDPPNLTGAPANLDFSTAQSRNFNELKPQLKQIFFIGDGLNSAGQQQEFVVPKGATRLYLATWDFYEWNNNAGDRTVKVERPQQIILVK